MCARFVENLTEKDFEGLLGFLPEDFEEMRRYNVAPTDEVGIVRTGDDGWEYARLRWGLVPYWSDDLKMGNRLINARAETAAEKPSFRHAFKHRRCLLPNGGFYEWTGRAGHKQPYYIHPARGRAWAFAGLWESNEKATGKCIETCTILTTAANNTIARLHDRMPVIIAKEDFAVWLGEVDSPKVKDLMKPCPDNWVSCHPVSTRVNSPRNDGDDLIVSIE